MPGTEVREPHQMVDCCIRQWDRGRELCERWSATQNNKGELVLEIRPGHLAVLEVDKQTLKTGCRYRGDDRGDEWQDIVGNFGAGPRLRHGNGDPLQLWRKE
jgi:hypothetical protein